MAAITKANPLYVGPPAEGAWIQRGQASVVLAAGDPVVIDGAANPDARYDTAYKKATAEAFVDGVALFPAAVGGTIEVMVTGEMDGFSGLTPGAAYTIVAGAIDTTAPAAGIAPQIKAVNKTRIMKLF